jgi:UDP-glucose 4-epimerase
VLDRAIPQAMGARRGGDPARLVCDGTRARAELGWAPSRSTMPRMIGDAWRWRETGRY